MSNLDEAFAAGYQWGAMLRGFAEVARRFNEGVKAAQVAAPKALTAAELDKHREVLAIARYRRRIAAEREAGLRYVRRIAAQARRDLGIGP